MFEVTSHGTTAKRNQEISTGTQDPKQICEHAGPNKNFTLNIPRTTGIYPRRLGRRHDPTINNLGHEPDSLGVHAQI